MLNPFWEQKNNSFKIIYFKKTLNLLKNKEKKPGDFIKKKIVLT